MVVNKAGFTIPPTTARTISVKVEPWHDGLVKSLTLHAVPGHLAVLRLPPGSQLPEWAMQGSFWCAVSTPFELSLICDPRNIPDLTPGLRIEGPWRALRVEGTLDFALTGIVSALSAPLAQAGIPIFAMSTFDTDYLLVKAHTWETAKEVLLKAGHQIT
jgi:hypothetical protein